MDYGVFDEASRDHEAEVAMRREALVRAAVSEEVMPFLGMAASEREYQHRRALADDHLQRIADTWDVPLTEVTAMADRLFTAMYQGRTAILQRTSSATCAACGHRNTDHSEGLRCPCGCTSFQPQTQEKEGRRVTAEEGDGPF
jgi:hypothetical protein